MHWAILGDRTHTLVFIQSEIPCKACIFSTYTFLLSLGLHLFSASAISLASLLGFTVLRVASCITAAWLLGGTYKTMALVGSVEE